MRARRGNVIGLVLRAVVVQVSLGLAIGIPVPLVGGRFMATQLYKVKSGDPWTLTLAATIPGACALRAACIDPIQALRTE